MNMDLVLRHFFVLFRDRKLNKRHPDSFMRTRLTISSRPASVIQQAVAILAEWIEPEHLRLGGGTALAARWNHRVSTDLGFFSASVEADTLFYSDFEQMLSDLLNFASIGRISSTDLRITQRVIVHFTIQQVPISFGRTDTIHGDSTAEVEAISGVVLSSNEDILTKKLQCRIASNSEITARDTYDFIVAASKDSDALSSAWSRLDRHMKNNVIELYRERDRIISPIEAASGPRGLIQATYSEVIPDLWNHARELFTSELSYRPLNHST